MKKTTFTRKHSRCRDERACYQSVKGRYIPMVRRRLLINSTLLTFALDVTNGQGG